MIKIAITGNIAAGKSTVEKILTEFDYPVYDTDKIAHNILESSQQVLDSFAFDNILTDGKIDRKKLGAVVFANPDKLKLLESIIHPEVKKEILKIFNNESTEFVFISVPQLFETGFDTLFDKIIFITADRTLRLKRLMERNDLTKEQAEIRINAQDLDETIKINKSNFVIENNSTVSALKEQLNTIIDELTKTNN